MSLVQEQVPGIHYFWDFDQHVSKLYGAAAGANDSDYCPRTFVLDERLRVVANIPFSQLAEDHVESVIGAFSSLPRFEASVAGRRSCSDTCRSTNLRAGIMSDSDPIL